MRIRKAAAILLSTLSFAAQATDVFKWVDEQGKVHYGSSVPEKYRDKSTRLESENLDVIDARRRQAEARAAREKAAADAQSKPQNAAPPSAAPAPKPKQAGGDTSCAEKWKHYKASIDCFAPFVNANGTVRAEAFEKCSTAKQPVECPTPVGSSNR